MFKRNPERVTLEKRPSLSAVWLKRRGAFNGRPVAFYDLGFKVPGLESIHSDGECWLTTRTVTGGSQTIGVSYRVPGFGGLYAEFHCPDCNRRYLTLYDRGGGYLCCRRCAGLWYAAQRRNHAQGRKALFAQRIRLKLGASAKLSEPFPQRPKNMKRRAYRYWQAMGEYYESDLSSRVKAKEPDYSVLTKR